MKQTVELPIVIEYETIQKRFEDNNNRQDYFKNNDNEYWNLINKAVIIACKMAEYYRNETITKNESIYLSDSVVINGGGGSCEEYTIFVCRNRAFWQPTLGKVYVNFKTKKISVRMSGSMEKKEYKKHIELDELKLFLDKWNKDSSQRV